MKIYKKDIYPYWWGINVLDSEEKWLNLNEVIDENDPEVGILFQYNNSQIEKLPSWLNTVRLNTKNFGLSVGQSIFWETWEKYINGNYEDAEVISEVSERFQHLSNFWSYS